MITVPLKIKIVVFCLVVLPAVMAVAACYKLSANRNCPSTYPGAGGACALIYPGSTYKFAWPTVEPGNTPKTPTPVCEYDCLNCTTKPKAYGDVLGTTACDE